MKELAPYLRHHSTAVVLMAMSSHIPMVLDLWLFGVPVFHAYRAKSISGELQSIPWRDPLFRVGTRVVRTCCPRLSSVIWESIVAIRGDIPFLHDLVDVEGMSLMQGRMNCFVISRA